MEPAITQIALYRLVADNPYVSAAWLDKATNPATVTVLTYATPYKANLAVFVDGDIIPLAISPHLRDLPFRVRQAPRLHDLRMPLPIGLAVNENQACQDEPIRLGCQIQPAGANWVGTAGAPVKWLDQAGKPHWGILSNWHVFCVNGAKKGHPQHQPTEAKPPVALLADWNSVTDLAENYLDAAIADAWLDGFHTISPNILQIGPTSGHTIDAKVGLMAIKSGRTTSLTTARCSATGATARVSYGDFTAIFSDQDIFEDTGPAFSAPGDSGSCIIGQACKCPCSLLFAGGGNLTIGNPIRYAVDRFNLVFPFN